MLKRQPETNLPATYDMVLNENNTREKAQIEARDRNDTVYTTIALAMPYVLIIPFDIVLKTDMDWPEGKYI